MYIPTMTLNEVTHRLRELGVSTSEVRVGEAIKRGLYPWGICVPAEGPRSHDRYEIYTVLFDRWAAERAVPQPGDMTMEEVVIQGRLQDTRGEAS